MPADRIVSLDYEVELRLNQLGLTTSELIGVVHQAVAAKAAFVLNHPLNAAGQLSYIYGTGAVRDTLRVKGWEIDRTGNIEVDLQPDNRHEDRVPELLTAPATTAAIRRRSPTRGRRRRKAVTLGQYSLFPEYEKEDEEQRKKENAALWYLFVHINGDDVRAELSFPKRIEDGQFKGFNERIYIIKPGEWASMMPKVDDGEPPAQDFEINVTRKS